MYGNKMWQLFKSEKCFSVTSLDLSCDTLFIEHVSAKCMLGGTVKSGRRLTVAQRVPRNVEVFRSMDYTLRVNNILAKLSEKKVERVLRGSRVNKILERSVKGAFSGVTGTEA